MQSCIAVDDPLAFLIGDFFFAFAFLEPYFQRPQGSNGPKYMSFFWDDGCLDPNVLKLEMVA